MVSFQAYPEQHSEPFGLIKEEKNEYQFESTI